MGNLDSTSLTVVAPAQLENYLSHVVLQSKFSETVHAAANWVHDCYNLGVQGSCTISSKLAENPLWQDIYVIICVIRGNQLPKQHCQLDPLSINDSELLKKHIPSFEIIRKKQLDILVEEIMEEFSGSKYYWSSTQPVQTPRCVQSCYMHMRTMNIRTWKILFQAFLTSFFMILWM